MRLIDEKKFLEAYKTVAMIRWNEGHAPTISYKEVKNILSKYLKDLPKKKKDSGYLDYSHVVAYNQCLDDCENK